MSSILSRLVPRQRKMSTQLGGLLIIVGETMFLFSILNFLMITRLQYYSSGDNLFRLLFPNYLLFLIGLSAVAFIGMWMTYVYVFPSKQKFSQEQAIKDDRSPMYNTILEMQKELCEMRATVESLSERMDLLAEERK